MTEGYDITAALNEQNGGSEQTLESADRQEVVNDTVESQGADEVVDNNQSLESETQEDVTDKSQHAEEVSSNQSEEEQPQVNTGSEIIDYNTEQTEDNTETVSNDNDAGFSISEILDGKFETVDALKERIDHLESIEQKYNESSNSDPEFANEFIKKMNDFVKAGKDPLEFAVIQSVKADELSPLEAIKTDLKWKYGLNDKEAESRIQKQYSTGEEDDDGNPILDTVGIKIDATDARNNIKSVQADNTIPEVDNSASRAEWEAEKDAELKEFQNQENQRMMDSTNGWMPKVDLGIDNLKKNGVIIPLGDNGKAFKFHYDGDESYTNGLIDRVDQALYDSGMNASDNPELAQSMINDIYFMENKDKIFKAYGEQVRSMNDEDWFKRTNNPSAIKRGDKVDEVKDSPSVEKQMEKIMFG